MLREERVARLRFDTAHDVLVVESASPLPSGMSGPTTAKLLLDAKGFLVGVDLGEDPSRVVLMLGRHEDVDRTVDVKVQVVLGSNVRIASAKSAVRADDPNPYST